MADCQLPTTFIANAADVLGHTKDGLSGSDIAKLMRSYGGEYEVEVPYPIYPNDAPNKRTALLENLRAFSGAQQHRILRELCDWKAPEPESPERRRIKIQLATTVQRFWGRERGQRHQRHADRRDQALAGRLSGGPGPLQ